MPNVALFKDRKGEYTPGQNAAPAGLGGILSATKNDDGGYDLKIASIGRSDAWEYGYGHLSPVDKRNEKSPDFRGTVQNPDRQRGWSVACWLKETGEGNAFLSLALTEQAPGQT